MLSICCKLFNYPSPDTTVSTSPARGEVLKHLFLVIRGHRLANLDCRISSGNDSKVECVTSGNDNVERVIDHRKKNTITFKGLNVVRQYAALLERRVQSSTRVRKAQVVTRQTNPLGRSMIEMLGVLAIIGVLSVGGIAGYSKAMEKWKVNKLIGEYTEFMFNAIEHADDIRKVPNGSGYADIMQSLNAIPTSWTYYNASNVHDRLNNRIQIWRGGSDLVFEIYLLEEYEVKDSYSLAEQRVQLCRELFLNFVQPLSEFVDYSYVWRGGAQTLNPLWYGNNYCGADKKCLKNVTLAEINTACHTCGDSNGTCSIVITY